MVPREQHEDNEPSLGQRWFAPTRWSLVKRAVDRRADLNTWIESYWYPLYAWARHKGCSPEDAADAVQGFLAKVCEKKLLARVDPSRGTLHSWLMTSLTNHLVSEHRKTRRLKRGGGAIHVSIDWKLAEDAYSTAHQVSDLPEDVFARAWALTLLDEALASLRHYFEDRGRLPLFEALLPLLDSPPKESTYPQIAEQLNMAPTAVRQATVRFRQRYRRTLLELAAKRLGINCEARLQVELRQMLGS